MAIKVCLEDYTSTMASQGTENSRLDTQKNVLQAGEHRSSSAHSFLAVAARPQAITLVAVFSLLAYRLETTVWRYSVNAVFWDQWEFYSPLFANASLWKVFTFQHGPHREGIGLIFDKFVLAASSWNTRVEAVFMIGVLFAAAVVALGLKQKLLGRLEYSDIIVPCLFLTFAQMEELIGAPNPSYSVFPELMIGLYCLSWLLDNPAARYGTVLLLNFLLIFTGFGFFVGIVTPGILALDLRRTLRVEPDKWILPSSALALAILSLGSFFLNYHWQPAVDCFVFPDPHPWKYLWFVSLLFAYFFRLRSALPATVFGVVVSLALVSMFLWHAVKLWREPRWSAVNLVITILIGYSFLFASNAAIGRVCLGMPGAAQFSRYMGLLVPALFALYLHVLSLREGFLRGGALTLFAIAILPATLLIPNGYSPAELQKGKEAWISCIRKTGAIDYCNRVYPSYPVPAATHMLEKLQFLQRNHLNIYSEDR